MRSLEEGRPTIQEEDPVAVWTRRTGRLVTRATPLPGARTLEHYELTYATCDSCLTVLRADGSCAPCTQARIPDPVFGLDDPQYRLDFGDGDGYTLDDRAADQALISRSAAVQAKQYRLARQPLDGCGVCGVLARGHRPARAVSVPGFEPARWGHDWQQPSNQTRIARLRARQAEGRRGWTS